MTKDEILQALRLTSMGRAGHPLQEQLAEKLEKLFATPEQRAEIEMAAFAADASWYAERTAELQAKAEALTAPKRRKKAD